MREKARIARRLTHYALGSIVAVEDGWPVRLALRSEPDWRRTVSVTEMDQSPVSGLLYVPEKAASAGLFPCGASPRNDGERVCRRSAFPSLSFVIRSRGAE